MVARVGDMAFVERRTDRHLYTVLRGSRDKSVFPPHLDTLDPGDLVLILAVEGSDVYVLSSQRLVQGWMSIHVLTVVSAFDR